jgi:hypothetical protein
MLELVNSWSLKKKKKVESYFDELFYYEFPVFVTILKNLSPWNVDLRNLKNVLKYLNIATDFLYYYRFLQLLLEYINPYPCFAFFIMEKKMQTEILVIFSSIIFYFYHEENLYTFYLIFPKLNKRYWIMELV